MRNPIDKFNAFLNTLPSDKIRAGLKYITVCLVAFLWCTYIEAFSLPSLEDKALKEKTKSTQAAESKAKVVPKLDKNNQPQVPVSSVTETAYIPTENDVKSFVYRWFAWLDHFVEDFLLLYHVSKEDLLMDLPEARIRSHEDFKKWYSKLRADIQTNSHEIRDITVKELPGFRYSVEFKDRFRAKTHKGQSTDAKFKHTWTLSVSSAGRLTINRYTVKKTR